MVEYVETDIRASNIGETITIRIDSFMREIGLIAGRNAIYVHVDDFPRLLEQMKKFYEKVKGEIDAKRNIFSNSNSQGSQLSKQD
jgi:hypothetical protein